MERLIDGIWRMKVSTVISPNDLMYNAKNDRHYYYVGQTNLFAIQNVLNLRAGYPQGLTPVTEILDFGCGHGRVQRWLKAAFPGARLHVTDLDTEATAFCCKTFGSRDTEGAIPQGAFDLIWLGSVFTHLPEALVRDLLDRLLAGLRPNGVLIFTTQGRYSIERMKDFDWENDTRKFMRYGLSQANFELLAQRYEDTGYGFVAHKGRPEYGVCVARPEWYARHVMRNNAYTQILFQEKGSDNHQDVSAFLRADITRADKGPLWRV